jgi:3-oxoacyl-[acyl-carrier protein] reductase
MTAGEPAEDQLRRDPLPLRGRVALVTGVSRRAGIGYAVARRLAALGASLFLHHYAPHDRDQPWGGDPGGAEAVVTGVRSALDAALLDAHWAVNTRATILLTQAFAARHDGRPGGRVIFMTSGQDLGPMTGEVAYAASKGALASVTRTLADQLAGQRITLNAVNPGPVDTGYASPEAYEAVRRYFPQQRWGVPDDPARLIAWLVTDEAVWVTGQVINSEGGFRRWT